MVSRTFTKEEECFGKSTRTGREYKEEKFETGILHSGYFCVSEWMITIVTTLI